MFYLALQFTWKKIIYMVLVSLFTQHLLIATPS